MPKHPEDTTNVSFQPPGRWVWKEESQTLEFSSHHPAEEAVKRKKSQTNVGFRELQLRAEWLAAVCSPSRRGRQSLTKSLSAAHLDSYRASVKKKQRDHVTLEDVKAAAVGLLQENYLLPIPSCFLDVLTSKELDGVLAALLLYLTCFFEHRSLENTAAALTSMATEQQKMAESLAKKEISQRKLAVCYFSLMMDLHNEQHPRHKGHMSNRTEWLLHACLYSFLCLVCWATLGRRRLRDIQEELGRLLYSDTFSRAARNATDNGSAADPEEAASGGAVRQRTSRRSSSLVSAANQRSPLMVSLLPSPKERSPHLFLAWSSRPSQAEHVHTEALTERLDLEPDLQPAAVRVGILGKPLEELSGSRDQKQLREDEDEDGKSQLVVLLN
ncbi:protein phosphatase 1 regulatory subunit 36 [Stegastes partitus]|uniref:Protein phosphatase 1 regulatory subunit 36 n=1 Tax=Stegastes partitus TaxID=144197 RepID=A0A9Y4NHJ3_9TELE|nr:PREDICTED: protein phosphatase 1 regulatory subunit 36 [Stegastes partitus]